MKEKTCSLCGVCHPVSFYHKHSGFADGLARKCKDCERARYARYREANREAVRERARLFARKPETLKKVRARKKLRAEFFATHKKEWKAMLKRHSEYQKQWRPKNAEKVKAHALVNQAKKKGTLIPLPCEVCGRKKVEAHHDDYSKPLKVRWLCMKHHREVHRKD